MRAEDQDALILDAARRDLHSYVCLMNEGYRPSRFSKALCWIVQEALMGRYKNKIVVVHAPPRHGKRLADSTEVLLWKRGAKFPKWMTHGDIEAGDRVLHHSGSWCNVTEVFEPGVIDRKITFTDGSEFLTHGDHQWQVLDRRNRKKPERGLEITPSVKTTDELRSDGLKLDNGYRFHVRQVSGYETHTDQPLPFDPYWFGYWLGDGVTGTAKIGVCSEDFPHVYARMKSIYPTLSTWADHGKKNGFHNMYFGRVYSKTGETHTDKRGRTGPLSLNTWIKRLGGKQIPDEYIYASREDRMALMAGMIDSDGSVGIDGRVVFTNSNLTLIEQFSQLVSSLGMRPVLSVMEPKVSTSGFYGRKKVYMVSFVTNLDFPTCLPRKKTASQSVSRIVSISNIEVLSENETTIGRCIMVDSEDHTYCVGRNFIVTHNSTVISETAPVWMTGHFPSKSVMVGAADEELAARFTTKMREKVADPRHLAMFGEKAALGVRARANDFVLNGGAEVKAAGMNSSIIGRGASVLIIDDPLGKLADARKQSVRDEIWTKFNEFVTRMNSGDFTIIVVAQRLHKDDLSGRLMRERKEDCVYFAFPALIEDEGDARRDALKRSLGEALVPELFTADDLSTKRRLLDPAEWQAAYKGVPPGEDGAVFKPEWLRRMDVDPEWASRNMTLYLLGDPAAAKNATSDYSAFFVIGCNEDGNFYILDGVRERLGLKERWEKYRDLWRKWRPMESWYEAYGASADLEYFRERQEAEKVIFEIKNSAYLTHSGRKRGENDKGEKEVRIERLIPQMSSGKWIAASNIERKRDRGDGTLESYDPVEEMMRDEMGDWPMSKHDDCLDAISRINDINVVWPVNAMPQRTMRVRSFASPW